LADPDDPMNVHDYDIDQLRELLIIERRNYRELSQTNAARLKRVDDLREEKLLVEDQLKSALARLETIDKINKARRGTLRGDSKRHLDELALYIQKLEQENDQQDLKLRKEAEATWAAEDSLRRYTDKEPDDAELQLLCLALAEFSLRRPGFLFAITELAKKIGGVKGEPYLTAFRQTSADLVEPLGDSLMVPKVKAT
jgi:hypothetical protein